MKTVEYNEKSLKTVAFSDETTDWYEVNHENFEIYGSLPDKELLTLRIPRDVAESTSKGVYERCGFGTGVRLRFSTNSTTLSLKVVYEKGHPGSVCTNVLVFGFDVYRFENGEEKFVCTFVPPENIADTLNASYKKQINHAQSLDFYTLNFPHFASVKQLLLGVDKGAYIGNGATYENEEPIVFYGSSITHGASASNPGNTYENFITHKYNYNYYNLGFAGCACGELSIAEYIAGLKMRIFVCDYDYNAPSLDHLMKTHYRLYEIVRKKNPEIPYVMISRPNAFLNPSIVEERKKIIIESYEKARSNGDQNVYFIDGATLFEGEFYESCTIDGIHPNDLGFLRMANVIGDLLRKIINKDK